MKAKACSLSLWERAGVRVGPRSRQALLDARSRGYGTAVLQAQGALGLGVYGRLGFRPFGEVAEYKPIR